MAISGNKGEWSEIYTLFKLLGDEKLYIGDSSQNQIKELYYPILQILRQEASKQFLFTIEQDIVHINIDQTEFLSLPCETFSQNAVLLLIEIQKGKNSFSVPHIEEFMNSFNLTRLKAISTDKADIKIVVHDFLTNINPLLGFSIKSCLGGDSTLVNAGKTTNFRYIIEDLDLSSEQIESINSIQSKSKIKERIDCIKKLGGNFICDGLCNKTYENNLLLIDTCMPRILAEMLLDKYFSNITTISELCRSLEQRNPLGFDLESNPNFYSYKIKRFLLDSALGLMPSKVWDGRYEANGGYIIVKEDGEIICYHIYNKNLFEDYLFNNTRLETASSKRHEFGKVEREKDKLYFKLNLQIRFL